MKDRSDKFGLNWAQQVEYNKVHSFGRDVNNQLRQRVVQDTENLNAQGILNLC